MYNTANLLRGISQINSAKECEGYYGTFPGNGRARPYPESFGMASADLYQTVSVGSNPSVPSSGVIGPTVGDTTCACIRSLTLHPRKLDRVSAYPREGRSTGSSRQYKVSNQSFACGLMQIARYRVSVTRLLCDTLRHTRMSSSTASEKNRGIFHISF
jgi:hypothetical protein